jgi:hypothetical protein
MRFIITVLLTFFLAAPALAGGPVGFVAAAKGDAQVNTQAARVGLEVFEGDKLVTGEKSRLKILFSDDVILSLGSGTEVVVEKHLFDPKAGARSTRLDLLKGTLRSLVQKVVAGNRADFVVKTGNAVAGVRGTEFVLVADEKETKLYTYSGEVDLSGGSGEQVLVAAGEGSDVGGAGEAQKPQAVAAAVLRSLREETDTEQSPEAVAWNLKLGEGDRLVAGAGGVLTAEEEDLDQEAMPAEGPVDLVDPIPKINPCEHCEPPDDVGPETSSNRFGGDGTAGGIYDMDGFGWENNTQLDRGSMTSMTLRITFRREHGP